jgi:hypothetical protein
VLIKCILLLSFLLLVLLLSSVYARVHMDPVVPYGPFSHTFEAFQSSMDPVDTSAQPALSRHLTTEQEESTDTLFMVM